MNERAIIDCAICEHNNTRYSGTSGDKILRGGLFYTKKAHLGRMSLIGGEGVPMSRVDFMSYEEKGPLLTASQFIFAWL